MRLAIADPPYLGRAARWYGDGPMPQSTTKATVPAKKADYHPDAAAWDQPNTHRELVRMLTLSYDGWAIAMAPDNLRHYLQWVPVDTRVTVWHKSRWMPGRARVINTWEPVLVFIPTKRRASDGLTNLPRDVMAGGERGAATFAGAKPAAWTRWVLDMLGYDPDTDTVDDLFGGSGAVAAEIAQGVLL